MKVSTIFGPIIAWAIASAVVLGCTEPAHALEGYSPKTAQEREVMLNLFVRTASCMHSGAKGALMQPDLFATRQDLVIFVMGACMTPMRTFLVGTSGWKDDDALKLLSRMAADAVYQEIRWGTKN